MIVVIDDPKCFYCGKSAIAYCDFIFRPGWVDGFEADALACDRPICVDHRRAVGRFCDRSRRTTNNQSDTIDHCREHAGEDAKK